jgi:hypothetical protein
MPEDFTYDALDLIHLFAPFFVKVGNKDRKEFSFY